MYSGLFFFSWFRYFCSFVTKFLWDSLYNFALLTLLLVFFIMRSPYVYGIMGYVMVLFLFLVPLFVSLFFTRLGGCLVFFSGFVPLGSPLWIAPFVSVAELISYCVRPVVLLFRPFINLTAGSVGGVALCNMVISVNYFIVLLCIFVFFYEVFVAMMHWFIIREILSFSVDH